MTRPPGRRGSGGRSPGRTGRRSGRRVKSSGDGGTVWGCGLILFALVASPTLLGLWLMAVTR